MDDLQQLKKEIEQIKKRNLLVEADKKWETSWFRKILLAILTYIVIVSFFLMTESEQPFLNALVPTTGFVLSTLSLSLFKKFWLKK